MSDPWPDAIRRSRDFSQAFACLQVLVVRIGFAPVVLAEQLNKFELATQILTDPAHFRGVKALHEGVIVAAPIAKIVEQLQQDRTQIDAISEVPGRSLELDINAD